MDSQPATRRASLVAAWLAVVGIVVGFALLLSGCATSGEGYRPLTGLSAASGRTVRQQLNESDSRVVQVHWRQDPWFVRRQTLPADAEPSRHPVDIEVDWLRERLASLYLEDEDAGPARGGVLGLRPAWGGGNRDLPGDALFEPEELDRIVAPLVLALAAAEAGEEVAFAIGTIRGGWRYVGPTTMTSGVMFVADGQVNLLLGDVHESYEGSARNSGLMQAFRVPDRQTATSLSAPLASTRADVDSRRTDWLRFPLPDTSSRSD
ncbi:hypothetical protein J2T57_002030 [Natronocella acetinitrilica]|uniref:Uncharacterized protein n=1 Tax=Natronocella acetinitrilica TaxID=414046 RepID=A0AAE3G6S3_9GAMM|nr:hypothetical protein [Natronocella acetinitrilica]MCP1674892.1 hypothetical protein [Natronocella acetinitrilica]